MAMVLPPEDRELALAATRLWGLTFFVGILFLLLGFVILGYDERSLTVLSIFIGISFLMTSLTWFLLAAVVDELKWFWVVSALLAFGGAIVAFAYPDETLKVLSLIIGWFLLLSGLVQFLVALTNRDREGWWLNLLVGFVMFALGAWAVGEDDRSLILLTTIVGVYCVLKGILEILLALKQRRLKRELLESTTG
jgi:uncharacterized membrane protein HdeD (DUF308 family)